MKTEDLKALGLNEEQAQRVFAMNGEDIKNLKASISTLAAERDAARTDLKAANEKLAGYDPEWKAKAEQAERKAGEQVAALQRDYAAQNAAAGLKFSSASAKKAFLADLKEKNLPLQDGKLMGFDDYCKAYRESDPGAFAPDREPVTVTVGGRGKTPATVGQDFLNGKYRDNPFYHPKGE